MAAVALWQNSTLRLIFTDKFLTEKHTHQPSRWWTAEANTTKAMVALLPVAMLWREDCTPVRNVEFNCHPCASLSLEKPSVQTPDSHFSSVLLAMLGLPGALPTSGFSPSFAQDENSFQTEISSVGVCNVHTASSPALTKRLLSFSGTQD